MCSRCMYVEIEFYIPEVVDLFPQFIFTLQIKSGFSRIATCTVHVLFIAQDESLKIMTKYLIICTYQL